jgi:hypothetical protein
MKKKQEHVAYMVETGIWIINRMHILPPGLASDFSCN